MASRLHHVGHDLPEPIEEPEEDTIDALDIGVCGVCDAHWQGKRICHCPTCHLTFTAISGFDDHRTGDHERDTRRCRTEAEIRARGYEPNDSGHWRQPMDEDSPTHWRTS